MYSQRIIHTSLMLAAMVAATPIATTYGPDLSDTVIEARFPETRLSREQVDYLKERQRQPAGTILNNVTFGSGEDTQIVPIVQADLDMLLDDEQGVKARALAARDPQVSAPAS